MAASRAKRETFPRVLNLIILDPGLGPGPSRIRRIRDALWTPNETSWLTDVAEIATSIHHEQQRGRGRDRTDLSANANCNSFVLIFTLNHFIRTITLIPPCINTSSPRRAHPTPTHGSRVGRNGAKYIYNIYNGCVQNVTPVQNIVVTLTSAKLRRVPVVQRRGVW